MLVSAPEELSSEKVEDESSTLLLFSTERDD